MKKKYINIGHAKYNTIAYLSPKFKKHSFNTFKKIKIFEKSIIFEKLKNCKHLLRLKWCLKTI